MRRALLYVGGWLAAVVVATAIGFAAVSLVGDDVGAPARTIALVATPQVTDGVEGDAQSQGGTAGSVAGTDDAKPATSSGGGGGTKTSAPVTYNGEQGTVVGLCRSGSPRLVSWSPKNDWAIAEVDSTGSRRAVVFSDGTTSVMVALRCSSNRPNFSVDTAEPSPTPEPTDTEEPTPTPTPSVGDAG